MKKSLVSFILFICVLIGGFWIVGKRYAIEYEQYETGTKQKVDHTDSVQKKQNDFPYAMTFFGSGEGKNTYFQSQFSKIYGYTMDQLALFEDQQIYFSFYDTDSPKKIENTHLDIMVYTGRVSIEFKNIDTGERISKEIDDINKKEGFDFPKELIRDDKNDIYTLIIRSLSPLTIINYAITQ